MMGWMILPFIFIVVLLIGRSGTIAASSTLSSKNVYGLRYNLKSRALYSWTDVVVDITNESMHRKLASEFNSTVNRTQVLASQVTSYNVIASFTTISERIESVYKSIYAILGGFIRPTQCYLFISRQSFLLDHGISLIPDNLLTLVALGLLRIVYVDNLGPHRKLLPLLSRHYYDNNTIIMTADDDRVYHPNLLYNLLSLFEKTDGQSVIAYRARLIGLCHGNVYRYSEYLNWMEVKTNGVHQMLVLPVGNGGVLYRPHFFHPVVFSPTFRNLTYANDDIHFRLSTMANNISVAVVRSTSLDLNGMMERHKLSLSEAPGHRASAVKHMEEVPYVEKRILVDHAERSRHLLESLHFANRQGRVNVQFEAALDYLYGQGVLPKFSKVIERYYTERDKKCYVSSESHCSMTMCDLSSTNSDSNSPVKALNITSLLKDVPIKQKMGGNKSKPVTDSARNVLMRRSREEAQRAANAVNPSVANASHVPQMDARDEQGPRNVEMDPMILNEMSKWSIVRSSDKPPKQVVTKGEPSAAIIRMREIKEREGLSPTELKLKNVGRLTEDQLKSLFEELRSDSSPEHTVKLANQYSISQLNIEMLNRYYRSAVITPPKEGEVYPVAS